MSGTGGSQRHCQSLKTHHLARDQVSLMRGMGNDLVVASFAAPPPPYVLLLGLAASSPNESGARCASLVRAHTHAHTTVNTSRSIFAITVACCRCH